MSRPFVSQVITGYLPSLILQLFLSFVPPIMKIFSSVEGYFSYSEIIKSACTKVLWFTIWNTFFANVISGSALYRVRLFLEPKKIPRLLAEAVSGQVNTDTHIHTPTPHTLGFLKFFLTSLFLRFLFLVGNVFHCICGDIWVDKCSFWAVPINTSSLLLFKKTSWKRNWWGSWRSFHSLSQ